MNPKTCPACGTYNPNPNGHGPNCQFAGLDGDSLAILRTYPLAIPQEGIKLIKEKITKMGIKIEEQPFFEIGDNIFFRGTDKEGIDYLIKASIDKGHGVIYIRNYKGWNDAFISYSKTPTILPEVST